MSSGPRCGPPGMTTTTAAKASLATAMFSVSDQDAARRLCLDAGFRGFQLHDVGDPANLYYEVRP